MTRTVEDCAILLQAIAGYDPLDPASANVLPEDYRAELRQGVGGLRIGAPLGYLEGVPDLSPETFTAFRAALDEFSRLGASVRPVDFPEHEHHQIVNSGILVAEAFTYHQATLSSHPELYGRRFISRLRDATLLSAADYLTLQRGRALIKRRMAELMQEIDVFALPTSTHPAETFADEQATPMWKRTSFTRPFNITGQPAISIPCGFSAQGLPIGLQLVGRPFEDAVVLRAAHAYEQATPWHHRHPTL